MMARMITPLRHLPLIAPVSEVFATEASDNDPLKNRERKRPQHHALAEAFTARNQDAPLIPSANPDYAVSQNMPPIDIQTILTYGYDPIKGCITLQTFKPL